MENSSDDGMFYDAKISSATLTSVPKNTTIKQLHNDKRHDDNDNDDNDDAVTNNSAIRNNNIDNINSSNTSTTTGTAKVHRNSITVGSDWRTSESRMYVFLLYLLSYLYWLFFVIISLTSAWN